MIFLKSRNILFLRPRKVGSTSFHYALAQNSKPTDICLLAGWMCYAVIWAKLGGHKAYNWSTNPKLEKQVNDQIEQIARDLPHTAQEMMEWGYPRKLAFYSHLNPHPNVRILPNHATSARVKAYLGSEAFMRAHKVSITRHPYDAIYSWAVHVLSCIHGDVTPSRISAKVDELIRQKWTNGNITLFEGALYCDTYIRYEHLMEDVLKFEKQFDLELTHHMKLYKFRDKGNQKSANEGLTEVQKERVYDISRDEFDHFGYEP